VVVSRRVLTISSSFHSIGWEESSVPASQFPQGGSSESMRYNPMQDLFQDYVSDLNKLRDAFHKAMSRSLLKFSKRWLLAENYAASAI
jgi:hypothetical protein